MDLDLLKRETVYLDTFMHRLDSIIEPAQQHRYHHIWGKRIMGSYDWVGDMLEGAKEFDCLVLTSYYPPRSVAAARVLQQWWLRILQK